MLSDEILLKRAGNFTASENHKLMAGWNVVAPDKDFQGFNSIYRVIRLAKKKPLVGDIKHLVDDVKVTVKLISDTWAVVQYEKPSKGLVTYAEEKAIEELFEPDPSLSFSTQHTRNGEERELTCMELLADETDLNFIHTGDNQIHIHTDNAGCTPDGIVLDELDLVKTGAEVKCKTALEHARNLLIKDGAELKEKAFDHYVQVQTAMLVTGALYWYFGNYNPFAKDIKLSFKYIIVDRDDSFIKILQSRIDTAKTIKQAFLSKLKKI